MKGFSFFFQIFEELYTRKPNFLSSFILENTRYWVLKKCASPNLLRNFNKLILKYNLLNFYSAAHLKKKLNTIKNAFFHLNLIKSNVID